MRALVFALVTLLWSLSAAAAIVVGAKSFVEQEILSAMTGQLLEARGFEVENQPDKESKQLRLAMEQGQVDIYWEYTGVSLVLFNRIEEFKEPGEAYETVKALDAERGIVWLDPSQVDNSNALVMHREVARAKGITSISDLAAAYRDDETLVLACTPDFRKRRDGLRRLQQAYNFYVPEAQIRPVDRVTGYQLLEEREVQVALAFSTDSRIWRMDFVQLVDDLIFFPSYTLAPVIRAPLLAQHPELAEPLNQLSAWLTNDLMAELIRQVQMKRQPPAAVARKFLLDSGLLTTRPEPAPPATPTD